MSIKIVIVAGTEFQVPAATDDEAIRQQLLTMGFADVAGATISRGTRAIDGADVPTIEFVKKAGTKGLTPPALAELLASVPRAPLPDTGPATLLGRLTSGRLTFRDLISHFDEVEAILDTEDATPGVDLCARAHAFPVPAATDVPGW